MSDPTSGVSGVKAKGGENDYDFAKEMTAAKAGEVRGFLNADGTTAYVMNSDGKTSMKRFAGYVCNDKEKMSLGENDLRQVAIQLAKKNGLEGLDPEDSPPAKKHIVFQIKEFANLVKSKSAAKDALSSSSSKSFVTPEAKPGTKKILGYGGGSSSGLDID